MAHHPRPWPTHTIFATQVDRVTLWEIHTDFNSQKYLFIDLSFKSYLIILLILCIFFNYFIIYFLSVYIQQTDTVFPIASLTVCCCCPDLWHKFGAHPWLIALKVKPCLCFSLRFSALLPFCYSSSMGFPAFPFPAMTLEALFIQLQEPGATIACCMLLGILSTQTYSGNCSNYWTNIYLFNYFS